MDELDADGATVTDSGFADAALTAPLIELSTRAGGIKVVPEPPGTRRGYDDLRRAATREPIGKGLRPLVASVGDLARTLAALGREVDQPRLRTLRRLSELERHLALEL